MEVMSTSLKTNYWDNKIDEIESWVGELQDTDHKNIHLEKRYSVIIMSQKTGQVLLKNV